VIYAFKAAKIRITFINRAKMGAQNPAEMKKRQAGRYFTLFLISVLVFRAHEMPSRSVYRCGCYPDLSRERWNLADRGAVLLQRRMFCCLISRIIVLLLLRLK
jgi:hypothetical protein